VVDPREAIEAVSPLPKASLLPTVQSSSCLPRGIEDFVAEAINPAWGNLIPIMARLSFIIPGMGEAAPAPQALSRRSPLPGAMEPSGLMKAIAVSNCSAPSEHIQGNGAAVDATEQEVPLTPVVLESPTMEAFTDQTEDVTHKERGNAPVTQRPCSPPEVVMPEFQELANPVCLTTAEPTSPLLVYSKRRRKIIEQEPLDKAVCVTVPSLTPRASIVSGSAFQEGDVGRMSDAPAPTEQVSMANAASVAVPTMIPLVDANSAAMDAAVGVVVPPATPLGAGTTSNSTLVNQVEATVGVAAPLETPSTIDASLTTRQAFIPKLTQQATAILSAPNTIRHCTKTMSAGQMPRRSRWVAGAQVEFSVTELERRSKKTMRTLGIIGEHDGITQLGQDEYSNLFGKPLADVHKEALSALFNWSIPDFADQDSEGVAVF
jgi:hypothetical protein